MFNAKALLALAVCVVVASSPAAAKHTKVPPHTVPATTMPSTIIPVPTPTTPCAPANCPIEQVAVCASNGMTYRNDCYFQQAKCHDPSLTILFNTSCPWPPLCVMSTCPPDTSPKVCGNDHVTYTTYCAMLVARCNQHNATLWYDHYGAC